MGQSTKTVLLTFLLLIICSSATKAQEHERFREFDSSIRETREFLRENADNNRVIEQRSRIPTSRVIEDSKFQEIYFNELDREYAISRNSDTDLQITQDYLLARRLFASDTISEKIPEKNALEELKEKFLSTDSKITKTVKSIPVVSTSQTKPFFSRLLGMIKGMFPQTDEDTERKHTEGLYAKDQFIIQLKPDLSTEEVTHTLDDRNLKLVGIYESLGMLLVELDTKGVSEAGLKTYTSPFSQTEFPTNMKLSKINSLSLDEKLEYSMAKSAYLQKNENIVGAFSNYSISEDQTVTPSTRNAEIEQAVLTQDVWWVDGVVPSQIRLNSSNTSNLTNIGVVDTGFSLKTDVSYSDGSDLIFEPKGVYTHGAIVSEIICKVMPKCHVYPYAITIEGADNSILMESNTGAKLKVRRASITQEVQAQETKQRANLRATLIGAALLEHLNKIAGQENSPFSVVSISMGSNWSTALGTDFELSPAQKFYVSSTANYFKDLINVLEKKQIIVFLSAGNDSTESRNISSKYNSPLHYRAVSSWQDENLNVVVVEAHDSTGAKIIRSNNEGMFSCPSPLILNEKLLNEKRTQLDESQKDIAMAATSFSTPVCAAAFTLLANYLADWPPTEVLGFCLSGIGGDDGSTTTKFNALAAATQCPQGTYAQNKEAQARCLKRVKEPGSEILQDAQFCKVKYHELLTP